MVFSMAAYFQNSCSDKQVDAAFKMGSVWVVDWEVLKWDMEEAKQKRTPRAASDDLGRVFPGNCVRIEGPMVSDHHPWDIICKQEGRQSSPTRGGGAADGIKFAGDGQRWVAAHFGTQ
eukprot:1563452-Pyramimonas_sp.AAC.1